ncbi:putative heat shock 70 kDa protein 14 [Paratrimastix pyriformis]|uniref:Heat shock 70 kDa protein 14 n=1 Tax=Paratrimastix pyriformis TaxID=342808 RepID=A0ABQ8UEE5_9EUKA|nr:putative heat shock 70 kDa protein 14 [Paratrimastix pyriformis]
MSSTLYGIDFGSKSTILAGTVDADGTKIATFLNNELSRSTPSLVCIRPNERVVGPSTTFSLSSNINNTATNLRTKLGGAIDPATNQPFPPLQAMYSGQMRTFTHEQICGIFFHTLIEQSKGPEEPTPAGTPTGTPAPQTNSPAPTTPVPAPASTPAASIQHPRCVISVPAHYRAPQRTALLTAARIGGLEPLGLLQDTTASAVAYACTRLRPDAGIRTPFHLLVADFGAEALQVGLYRLTRTMAGVTVEALATEWDQTVGGTAMDSLLVEHFMGKLAEQFPALARQPELLRAPKTQMRLRRECERLKTILSANSKAVVAVENLTDSIDTALSLTRAEFEGILQAAQFPARVAACLGRLMERAAAGSKAPVELDVVEPLGGASRVPLMQAALSQALNDLPQCVARPGSPAATPAPVAEGSPAPGRITLSHQLSGTDAVAWGCAKFAAQLVLDRQGGQQVVPNPRRVQVSVTDVSSFDVFLCLATGPAPVPAPAAVESAASPSESHARIIALPTLLSGISSHLTHMIEPSSCHGHRQPSSPSSHLPHAPATPAAAPADDTATAAAAAPMQIEPAQPQPQTAAESRCGCGAGCEPTSISVEGSTVTSTRCRCVLAFKRGTRLPTHGTFRFVGQVAPSPQGTFVFGLRDRPAAPAAAAAPVTCPDPTNVLAQFTVPAVPPQAHHGDDATPTPSPAVPQTECVGVLLNLDENQLSAVGTAFVVENITAEPSPAPTMEVEQQPATAAAPARSSIRRVVPVTGWQAPGTVDPAMQQQLADEEVRMSMHDATTREAGAARNLLEGYIYEMRQKCGEDFMLGAMSAQDRRTFAGMLEEAMRLVGDQDPDAEPLQSIAVYQQKLADLKRWIAPIEKRYMDETERRKVLGQLRETLLAAKRIQNKVHPYASEGAFKDDVAALRDVIARADVAVGAAQAGIEARLTQLRSDDAQIEAGQPSPGSPALGGPASATTADLQTILQTLQRLSAGYPFGDFFAPQSFVDDDFATAQQPQMAWGEGEEPIEPEEEQAYPPTPQQPPQPPQPQPQPFYGGRPARRQPQLPVGMLDLRDPFGFGAAPAGGYEEEEPYRQMPPRFRPAGYPQTGYPYGPQAAYVPPPPPPARERPAPAALAQQEWAPHIDMQETPAEQIVYVELPGVQKKDISLRVEGDNMVIEGFKRPSFFEEDGIMSRMESPSGHFSRALALSPAVDRSRIRADFSEGILKVVIPKLPQYPQAPSRIAIF